MTHITEICMCLKDELMQAIIIDYAIHIVHKVSIEIPLSLISFFHNKSFQFKSCCKFQSFLLSLMPHSLICSFEIKYLLNSSIVIVLNELCTYK